MKIVWINKNASATHAGKRFAYGKEIPCNVLPASTIDSWLKRGWIEIIQEELPVECESVGFHLYQSLNPVDAGIKKKRGRKPGKKQ